MELLFFAVLGAGFVLFVLMVIQAERGYEAKRRGHEQQVARVVKAMEIDGEE